MNKTNAKPMQDAAHAGNERTPKVSGVITESVSAAETLPRHRVVSCVSCTYNFNNKNIKWDETRLILNILSHTRKGNK